MKTLRLVLGDQLNYKHSWFNKKDDDITYLMMELRQETDYVRHHIQKVLAFFGAMRAFADWLGGKGHRVVYIKLDDESNRQDFGKNIKRLIEDNGFRRFEYMEPDEYRLDRQLAALCNELEVETAMVSSEHFISQRDDLKKFFKGKKSPLMESFYREMRRKHNILMDGDKPLTGQWNYDQKNRKPLKKDIKLPEALSFDHDLSDIAGMIDKAGVKTIGTAKPKKVPWPLTRREALKLLDNFCDNLLPQFGTYQDAMTTRHQTLFHSRLSFALNTKMLHPMEVLEKSVSAWRKDKKKIAFQQIEGFVRQVIGWREFMRGIYWAYMPDFAHKNYLQQQRKLPQWYWTGDTKMNCLHRAIGQSLETAYAHHIQRLMVTGNFALLAGIDPREVDAWYLGIYIDAIEWVEITNTRGMSQFADGGIVGTKPYVSSANYINKMSDYCNDCFYSHSKRTGDKACPFNSLYWNFYMRHEEKLGNNPRIGMAYRNLQRMEEKTKNEIREQAEHYLNNLDKL